MIRLLWFLFKYIVIGAGWHFHRWRPLSSGYYNLGDGYLQTVVIRQCTVCGTQIAWLEKDDDIEYCSPEHANSCLLNIEETDDEDKHNRPQPSGHGGDGSANQCCS